MNSLSSSNTNALNGNHTNGVLNRSFFHICIMIPLLLFAGCGSNGEGIEASGILESVEVNISSKVAGQILKFYVEEGSVVADGDTLAVIDSEMQKLQLQQAMAGVALAESQLQLLKNGARTEDLQSADEAVRQTESAFNSAKADFERIKNLYESRSVSSKQYEDAESRLTIMRAQYNAALNNKQKLERFARPEDLNGAKARVDQAIAQANVFRKQIADSYILSPVSGTVTFRPSEEGELIGTGAIIAKISRLERMELMIYVKETELGKVKLGGNAEVMIDTYPEKKYPATVVYISPSAEFTPRNVQTKDERTKLVFGVKLQVDNSNGELKSGMPADALLK